MRFRDLGPLDLDVAGRQVSPGPPQQRAVLAALLVDAPHPVQVTALLDRIWGEKSPTTVTKSIQKYVGNLRRVLGPDVITRVGDGYRLQALDDAIDSRRFIALTRQATDLTDRADRFGVLSEALGLFRGPMLADVDAPFAGIERARLDELRLAAEEDLLHAQLAFDSPAVVAAACERFVAEHPYRERAWQALMIALYRSGRQRDALAAYRRLRRNLVDELGVDPGPELRALERSILNQDGALLGEGPGPRGSTGTFTELRTVTLVSAQPDDAGDPEAFERLMAELADRVADLAGRFGGRSSHDPRTGPLIVLGAPATGDEPRRAAQLALELATAPACPRVAIATGTAMVRSTSEGLDVVGELANRVRLRAALAEPGSVVLDGATAARLSGLADLAAASGGDAVLVRLLQAQPMSTAEFTGRTGELAEILALADDCVSAGKSRLVTIRGEAGIGKTRLVHELRRALADRGSAEHWVEAACRPHGDGRYAPIARLLAQVTAPDVPVWAWSTYLTSGVGPAVVVVEDLHNADETLPGFVDELLHLAAALPVLVVCTTRPVEAPKAPMGGRRSTLIELTELDDGESARLLTSLAGPELGPARRSAVVERARGNPLFLIELAQVASDGAEPGQLPGSLEEAITARIDLLHQDDRRMLGFVAVAAAPVEIAVAADVVPVSHREAAGCLERLRRFGLLDVELGPQGSRFVVHHPLICETAARLVPRSRLVAWHLGLARRIERSPQTVENLERRAFHLDQVVDLAPDTPGIRRDLGLAQSALGAA
ncbi:MAG: BTAD domain-containing putative transcriptional regulator, partial [Kineosporiaceae bacterium]